MAEKFTDKIVDFVQDDLIPWWYEGSVFNAVDRLNQSGGRGTEGAVQLSDYKAGKIDSTQINEEQRPIGSKAILNGEEVYWAGQNYEYQSKGSYDKLMKEGQFRMGQIAGQRLGNDFNNYIPTPVKDLATSAIDHVAQTSVDVYQNNPTVKATIDSPAVQGAFKIVNGGIHIADDILEWVSATTNTSRFITDEVAVGALTAGTSIVGKKAATSLGTPIVRRVAKEALDAAVTPYDQLRLRSAANRLKESVKLPRPGPGPGSGPQLVPAGGSIRMTADAAPPPPTVMRATTSPEWTARGAGQNVSTKSQFKGQVTAYDERLRLYDEAVEIERAKFDRGEIDEYRLKATLTKIQKMRTSDEVTFEYVRNLPDDHPLVEIHRYAFKQNITGSFNPSISIPGFSGPRSQVQQVLKRGAASKWAKTWDRVDPWEPKKLAQQHHILAKAETTPFAETLNRLRKAGAADDDDLVNFFLWSEQYDLFPGNVAENLLDMGEITHTVARKDPMALHNILKEAQLEFGGVTKKEIAKRYGLDKVKTTDELMEAYDRYLREIAVPSKDITYKVYDYWVEKTRRSLKGQALIDFNERVKALNVPRELEGWDRNNKRTP